MTLSPRSRALCCWLSFAASGCVEDDPTSAGDGDGDGDGDEGPADDGGNGSIPECHPLDQNCPGGEVCYHTQEGSGFECFPDPGTGEGFGGPCWSSLECAPGFTCALTEVVPNCAEGAGCCTYLCELDDGCPNGLECYAIYPNGGPPGFEDLGQCVPVGS